MCTADGDTCCTNPRNAHTRLVVLERGLYMSYPATKVLLQLMTGRRHQIRVHCSTIGHTIVGDYTYSGRKDTSPNRTFLHSYRCVLFIISPSGDSDKNENHYIISRTHVYVIFRLELGVDSINVQTNDPFTKNELNGLWIPVEFVNELGTDCSQLFNS